MSPEDETVDDKGSRKSRGQRQQQSKPDNKSRRSDGSLISDGHGSGGLAEASSKGVGQTRSTSTTSSGGTPAASKKPAMGVDNSSKRSAANSGPASVIVAAGGGGADAQPQQQGRSQQQQHGKQRRLAADHKSSYTKKTASAMRLRQVAPKVHAKATHYGALDSSATTTKATANFAQSKPATATTASTAAAAALRPAAAAHAQPLGSRIAKSFNSNNSSSSSPTTPQRLQRQLERPIASFPSLPIEQANRQDRKSAADNLQRAAAAEEQQRKLKSDRQQGAIKNPTRSSGPLSLSSQSSQPNSSALLTAKSSLFDSVLDRQQQHQTQSRFHQSRGSLSSASSNKQKLLFSTSSNNNNSSFHNMADQSVIDKLEAGYAKLQAATPEQCHSLLKKYLTREVLDKCKTRKTAMGATLLDVAQSGFENLDSGVGIYAPDAESYTLFKELFDPIIEDYHGGFKPTDKHPASDFGDLETLVNVDPHNEYVISTRVRCGRSLKGYPFNPCLTEAQYKEMEDKVSSTFKQMEGDLAGTYYPLTGMTKETQQQLIDDHFLFKEGDRFLQAANACRYWPTGRGIYHNAAKTFLVWVNEEDHLRIISMQKGGDLKQVFGRLVQGARAIEAKVPFSRDERLGFLTFCPTNLGTTIRASVHIKLPKLAADRKKLEEVAARYNLQVRGTSGEHTESVGGVYDISNKRRLGLTEYQAVREMQDGILELIKIEKSL